MAANKLLMRLTESDCVCILRLIEKIGLNIAKLVFVEGLSVREDDFRFLRQGLSKVYEETRQIGGKHTATYTFQLSSFSLSSSSFSGISRA